MTNVKQTSRRAVQVTACLLLGWTGCASTDANREIISPPTETTTSAAVPTANGTYDRSKDPSASNSGVGTTEAKGQAPVAIAITSPMGATPVVDATLTDGQIAGIASTIDLGEIDAGKVALTHAKASKVRQFAQHMVSAHTDVETKLTAMLKTQSIAPADSAIGTQLKSDSASLKQTLMGQSGTDFDRSYMQAQLKGHQDALDLFDNKLLPQAQNPQLKAALAQTRAKVVAHIQMAQDTLSSLPSQ